MKPTLSPENVRGLEVRDLTPGRPYHEALEAAAGKTFSAGIWYLVHPLGDRFGPRQTALSVSVEQAIEFCYRFGVKRITWHYPNEVSEANHARIGQMLSERNMSYGCIGGNVFGDPVFKTGGPSSHEPQVRELAKQINTRAHELMAQYGCAFHVDWAGRDGHDGVFLYDTDAQWEWTLQAYADILMHVAGKVGWAIEFKPYDAMEQSVLKNIDGALLMCEQVERRIYEQIAKQTVTEFGADRPYSQVQTEIEKRFASYRGKMGVNIEDAHVYIGGQRVSDAVRKALQHDRLFLRHENDVGGPLDTDRIFASVHFWDAVETCYYQIVNGYDEKGFAHEPDIFPQRDDPLKAYVQSINAINFCYALAERLRDDPIPLERIKQTKHTSAAMDWLMQHLAAGVSYPRIDLALVDQFRKDVGASA